jgi:hypothetical protein
MSLTYGYDVKEGDDMIAVPVQVAETMLPLVMPGAALVNNFPFCAITFVTITVLASHNHFSEIHPFMGAMAQL